MLKQRRFTEKQRSIKQANRLIREGMSIYSEERLTTAFNKFTQKELDCLIAELIHANHVASGTRNRIDGPESYKE